MRERHAAVVRGMCTMLWFLLCFWVMPAQAEASADPLAYTPRVVRVGVSEFPNFSQLGEDGSRRGIVFDYLDEICKYSGWQLELVELPVSLGIERLASGEIDLMGAMLKSEQTIEMYDFAEMSSGYSYSTITVKKSRPREEVDNNYDVLNKMRVGIYTKAITRADAFAQFCRLNGIEVEPVYFDDPDQWEEAFATGVVDAQLTSSAKLREDEEILVSFQEEQYYFAVTKGKSDLMRELNLALEQINKIRPLFASELYEKYFGNGGEETLLLTEREQQFIRDNPVLRVVAAPDWKPISYFDHETGRLSGISGDMLALLGESTGLTFEYLPTETFEEALALLGTGQADLVAGIYDTQFIDRHLDVTLSMPYLPTQTVLVQRRDTDLQALEHLTLVMPYGFDYIDAPENCEIRYCDTAAQCVDAVKRGTADYTALSNLAAEQLFRVKGKGSLTVIPVPKSSAQLSIAFRNPTNPLLFSIIDKAIHLIPAESKQDILFRNVSAANSEVTLSTFIYANPMQSLGIISIVAALVLLLVYHAMGLRLKLSRALTQNAEAEARTDSLTGLYNKKHAEQLARASLAAGDRAAAGSCGAVAAMLILDLDDFKQVNAALGHLGGDAVLIALAEVLRDTFCGGEILGRWGGDEFFVFVESAPDRGCVVERADQLCAEMTRTFTFAGATHSISVSAGIAFASAQGDDCFERMFQAADGALYEAKRHGKNGYSVASDVESQVE